MILVTGPTGSGKSTTLYTTLNAVARPEINVITVEDPVEYRMHGINQVQVNPKAGLTFAERASVASCAADPDVVLLGEIRDHETAQIAIEASLTGHLVLSTLHTNDAPSADHPSHRDGHRAVPRRLRARLRGRPASRPSPLRPLQDAVRRRPARRPRRQPLSVAAGRASADRSSGPSAARPARTPGYRGRIAVHEVMAVTEEIERLAVERASSAEIGRVAREQGMLTLREDGWAKVSAGITSVEEILRVVA